MSHRPRKRYGQHFLHDRHVIQRIIGAIAPDEPEPIVEIGPGKGALTIPLLRAKGRLDVIEIDRDLAATLAEVCDTEGSLNLHVTDALEFNFCDLGLDHLKIVGNLPYNISTPLIFHLLENISCIASMVFMLQKEVVDRICAVPGSSEYGRLSVMVQSRCTVNRLFNIAPGSFTPPPKVESSMIKLIPKPDADCRIYDRELFARLVKQAFSHRRKTIRNSLTGLVDASLITRAGLALSARAQQLTLADFTRLANLLHDIHKND